ncbi:hypothetical protein ACFQ36_05155 [Arthrobacter sp. GCM10027362]|uniref:hypothetical protein n=1 Tax=Arthrobacter sp. GCM10027362 TaxID=3273379 RepID=UPI00362BFB57
MRFMEPFVELLDRGPVALPGRPGDAGGGIDGAVIDVVDDVFSPRTAQAGVVFQEKRGEPLQALGVGSGGLRAAGAGVDLGQPGGGVGFDQAVHGEHTES